MQCGDHRDGHADPVVGGSLEEVRRLAVELGVETVLTLGRHETGDVEPRAEAGALAAEHDGTNAVLLPEL